MSDLVYIAIIVVLSLSLGVMYGLYRKSNTYAEFFQEQWQKWEAEYYLLRTSEAVKPDYEVRLSWLQLGTDRAVQKKGD